MATIKAFVRTSLKKTNKANIRFRLSGGRNIQLFHKSEIEVESDCFDTKNECIKARVIYDQFKREEFNKKVAKRKHLILEIYNAETIKENLTSEWLNNNIDKALHPEKYFVDEKKPNSFFEIFEAYIESYRGTERMKQHYRSVKRILQRFELYKQKSQPKFTLALESLNAEILRDIEEFIHQEHKLFEKHSDIYKAVPDSRPPKQRGRNRTNKIFRYIRTVVRWAIEENLTTIHSFPKFKIKEDIYGTPIYISIEERNHLYHFDLSANPELAIQRDIFVFQCLIGCRVGDLNKLGKSSLIGGSIEYIARKTSEELPITVRVPLNSISKEIINRYSDINGEKLLPFISEHKYRKAIKEMFKLAGLTRMVTIINPTTGKEEKRALNEVASSHIARKTFIGNLYKKVKDPNLVGALSGHKEGSRAFARYREIDDEIKKDLVKMLE